MIANIKILEKYCTDYKNIENYDTAIKSPLRYDLHHRNEISEHKSKKQLITENLYYWRPASDLIFLEQREHMRLHREGKHPSTETRQKISDAMKGKNVGKHLSAESRQRMSEVRKGKHWHTENSHRIWTE